LSQYAARLQRDRSSVTAVFLQKSHVGDWFLEEWAFKDELDVVGLAVAIDALENLGALNRGQSGDTSEQCNRLRKVTSVFSIKLCALQARLSTPTGTKQ